MVLTPFTLNMYGFLLPPLFFAEANYVPRLYIVYCQLIVSKELVQYFFFFLRCWQSTKGAVSEYEVKRQVGNLQAHIFMLFVRGECVCMCERTDSSVVGRMWLHVGPGDFVHVRLS